MIASAASAAELAREFAATAAQHDRDGSFPFANVARLHEAGFLALAIPPRYGGGGATLSALCDAVRTIAQGDASTALVLVMHLAVHASIARGERWPRDIVERVFGDAVARGALINVVGTEPDLGSPARGGRPRTRAARSGGGWRISGTKSCATGAAVLSYLVVYAASAEPDGPVGFWLVPRSAAGITVRPTWNHLGMRASASHEIDFDDVFVPLDHAVDVVTPDQPPRTSAGTTAWWMCMLAALYAGIADAAAEWLVTYLNERTPPNLGAPLAALPRVQEAVGEIEALRLNNRMLIASVAQRIDRGLEASGDESRMVKHLVTENAVAAVDKAVRLAGLSGLSRDNPLERYHRDVLYARLHPPQGDAVLGAAGRAALGRGGEA